jgi:hypothetical protein
MGLAMCEDEIFLHPCYKVVLEGTFDDLMQEIWCDQFIYVCMQKHIGEWLNGTVSTEMSGIEMLHTIAPLMMPYISQSTLGCSNTTKAFMCFLEQGKPLVSMDWGCAVHLLPTSIQNKKVVHAHRLG